MRKLREIKTCLNKQNQMGPPWMQLAGVLKVNTCILAHVTLDNTSSVSVYVTLFDLIPRRKMFDMYDLKHFYHLHAINNFTKCKRKIIVQIIMRT